MAAAYINNQVTGAANTIARASSDAWDYLTEPDDNLAQTNMSALSQQQSASAAVNAYMQNSVDRNSMNDEWSDEKMEALRNKPLSEIEKSMFMTPENMIADIMGNDQINSEIARQNFEINGNMSVDSDKFFKENFDRLSSTGFTDGDLNDLNKMSHQTAVNKFSDWYGKPDDVGVDYGNSGVASSNEVSLDLASKDEMAQMIENSNKFMAAYNKGVNSKPPSALNFSASATFRLGVKDGPAIKGSIIDGDLTSFDNLKDSTKLAVELYGVTADSKGGFIGPAGGIKNSNVDDSSPTAIDISYGFGGVRVDSNGGVGGYVGKGVDTKYLETSVEASGSFNIINFTRKFSMVNGWFEVNLELQRQKQNKEK